jgi:hypothetical protein
MGFHPVVSDAGLFVKHDNGVMILAVIYVDDKFFASSSKTLAHKYKAEFMTHWEARDLGEVSEYLGMTITRSDGNVKIDQKLYLEKVHSRFRMADCKPATTLLPENYKPVDNKDPENAERKKQFQTVIGSLLYLMLGTRPNIAYAVIKMSQFSANPSEDHLNKAMHICRYLAGTRDYSIEYSAKNDQGLIAFTDSDWAENLSHAEDTSGRSIRRRSTSGFFYKLADGAISWTSHAQKGIALSSTEAEYMALSDCSRQASWL